MHPASSCLSTLSTERKTKVTQRMGGASPIFKLPTDLLWRIFVMNANMEEDEDITYFSTKDIYSANRALTNARRSSQVCLHWRRVILNSPSLWGRIVDFSLFRQHTDFWMNKIVQRAKDSPLHIVGNSESSKRSEYALSLLDRCWDRVCILDLRLCSYTTPQADRLRDILSRHSRTLQSFRVGLQPMGDKLTGQVYQFTFDSHSPLFSNDAPLLKRFVWESYKFDTKSSWLSGLRSLNICNTMIYNATDFFATLKRMPLLEVLELPRFQLTFDKQGIEEPLNIPRLRHISMGGNLWMVIKFLDPITPAPECSIALDLIYQKESVIDGNLVDACRVLHRYTKSYFLHHVSTSLHLELTPTCVRLADSTPTTLEEKKLCIDLFLRNEPDDYDQILQLFSPLTQSKLFASVAHIHFSTLASIACACNHYLMPFIAGLHSTEILMTSEESLRFLYPNGEQETEMALRSLHTLSLYSGPGGGSVRGAASTTSANTVLTFLRWRNGLGLPIKVLDFTGYWGYTRDLRALEEEMPGVKVIWSVNFPSKPTDHREYICGSGTPDMLKISCTAPVPPEHDGDFKYFICFPEEDDEDTEYEKFDSEEDTEDQDEI